MKRSLVYGGLGVCVAAAWAALDGRQHETASVLARDAPVPQPASAPGNEPAPRPFLQLALRDPFMPAPPPAPQAAAPAPPPPPPPAPTPPPLNLQFAGRMTAPDGSAVVYVMQGSTTVPISVGMTLQNGYRVDEIKQDAIHLSFAPLNTKTQLALPAAPSFEVR